MLTTAYTGVLYPAPSLETAACLWEAVLTMEQAAIGDPAEFLPSALAIQATREAIGTSALRSMVLGWVDAVDAAWHEADTAGGTVPGGGEYGDCFDWEFCPDWITVNVDWSDPQNGPTVRTPAPAPAPAVSFATPAHAIADAFATAIEQDCADDLETIRARNASPAYAGCCASHDFCDANMPMADAFEAVMGRPFVPADGPVADADLTLVNEAWNIARTSRLTAPVSTGTTATMSLEQFRDSGTDEASIGDIVLDEALIGCEGRVYEGLLYIERWTDDRAGVAPPSGPTWLLTLGNEQVSGDLPELESRLYDWACREGYCAA